MSSLAPFFLLSLFDLCSSQSVHDPEARLIINGSLTEVRYHPWVVKLNVLGRVYWPLNLGVGSGTILSNRWILTAAHNFDDIGYGNVTTVAVKIRVGISNITERGQVTDVELYRCHPLYTPGSRHHDICLIKTADSLEFDDTVQPVHLPTKSDNTSNLVNIASFGSMDEDGGGSLELRETWMVVLDKSECEKKWKNYDDSVDICTWDPLKSGPCSGDSGSGFIATRWSDRSKVILGVLTRGNCYDRAFGPRVLAYVEWIKSVMSQYE